MTVHALDWGDVPTWVGAVTTLGALIAAGVVVVIELRRERRTEGLLQEQRDQAARAEQADLVAAWGDAQQGHPGILVRNGSHLPIYDVLIQLTHPTEAARDLQRQRILPPGDIRAGYPDDIVSNYGDGVAIDESQSWGIRLYFYDAAGRHWLRDELGQLGAQPVDHGPQL